MGTSNWQNIPFCVEVLITVAPRRVLDVGVGFGRWGMVVREFCENWFGRELPSDWEIHVEGIEAFAECIADYHRGFYDQIHVADAREILPSLLEERWDMVIFGDVLEHFAKEESVGFLGGAIQSSIYVLVNVPLGAGWAQAGKYGNPFECHLSDWTVEDFLAFPLRRQALFGDYLGRPFGSFVFSRLDPKGVAHSLFSRVSVPVSAPGLAPTTPSDQKLLAQVQQLSLELDCIKNSYTWQFGQKIALSPVGRVALRLLQTAHRLGGLSITGRPKDR